MKWACEKGKHFDEKKGKIFDRKRGLLIKKKGPFDQKTKPKNVKKHVMFLAPFFDQKADFLIKNVVLAFLSKKRGGK